MEQIFSYNIIHIDLSKVDLLLPPFKNENGNYVILWWKDIALGDFYIKPNQNLYEEEFLNKIISAILPIIDSYNEKTNIKRDWRNYLITNQIQDWKKLDLLFSSADVEALPEKVPISVVICTRDRAASLSQCLEQIKNLICQPEEIVVVDNAPLDRSTRQIVKQFPDVKYVIEPKAGLDFARNAGIMAASQSITAFVDDDVRVHPFWAYRVWETFQNPSVSAMTGLVIALKLDSEAQFIFEKHWSFNRGYLDKIYDKAYFSSLKAPPVWEIGAGANMAFRKSVFEKVGNFHELLDVGAAGCSGDSEMWFRILADGDTIQYNPKAVVYHEHRSNIKALEKQLFSYMRGFTTAALWQHRQIPKLGYKKLVFLGLPKYYAVLLAKGFPRYRERYRTLWAEIKGVISGLMYFYKRKNRSLFSVKR